MRQITNRKFYTYRQAAERVQRTPQTIRKWRMAGMPMTWNQQGERVVAHEILLAELRRRNEADCRAHTLEARAARAEFEADPIAWFMSDDEPTTPQTTSDAPRTDYPATVRPRPARPLRTALAASASRPAPVRLTSAPAWDRLRAALATTAPDCAEDGRFTLDTLVPGEAEHLARVCAGCPLLSACADYARDANPSGGFWPTPENMAALTTDRAA